jgi:hypothetical protein
MRQRKPASWRSRIATMAALLCICGSPVLGQTVDSDEIMDQPDSPALITKCDVSTTWHLVGHKLSYIYKASIQAKNTSDSTLLSIAIIIFGETRGGRVLFAGKAVPDGDTKPGAYSTLIHGSETGSSDDQEIVNRNKHLDHYVCAVAQAIPTDGDTFIDDRVVQLYKAAGGSDE